MERVYLDHNASSPLRPEARAAMLAAMDACGNPSSVHAEGRAARAIVEGARETVANAFNVNASQVIFTSGGTEAANMLLSPSTRVDGQEAGALLIAATEHACVMNGHGFDQDRVKILPVDPHDFSDGNLQQPVHSGFVDTWALFTALNDCKEQNLKPLVAIQAANNETGIALFFPILQGIVESGEAASICDAVQLIGRMNDRLVSDVADVFFISAHKFGGPKGAGAIVSVRDRVQLASFVRGGGQERRLRAGTENVAAIAGMSAALTVAVNEVETQGEFGKQKRTRLESGLRAISPDVVIFGDNLGWLRLPNTTCFAAPGVPAEIALMAFDLEGVAVSSGSACSSGKVAPSHVLAAMGVAPDLAKCAIRVSTGWTTTDADIERFLQVWEKIYTRLRPRAAA